MHQFSSLSISAPLPLSGDDKIHVTFRKLKRIREFHYTYCTFSLRIKKPLKQTRSKGSSSATSFELPPKTYDGKSRVDVRELQITKITRKLIEVSNTSMTAMRSFSIVSDKGLVWSIKEELIKISTVELYYSFCLKYGQNVEQLLDVSSRRNERRNFQQTSCFIPLQKFRNNVRLPCAGDDDECR